MTIAVLDACVLYPAMLRDFFMRLAVNLYQPKWTAQIHDEWMLNLLEDRPNLTQVQLSRTRELMDRHGGNCIVTGHESLIHSLSLPDPDDRHVLAAAVVSHATVIVTFNLRDFPRSVLSNLGIEAVHPDKFAVGLYESDPDPFVALASRHRLALRNPPRQVEEYLDALKHCGLQNTAICLGRHRDEL